MWSLNKSGRKAAQQVRFLNLMSVVQFDVFAAYPAVEGHPRVREFTSGVVCLAGHDKSRVEAPKCGQTHGEANNGEYNPMGGHPEDELDIVVVPAVAQVVCEKAPAVIVVLCGKEDAHAIRFLWLGLVVVAPDDTKIQRTSRGHDGDVRQRPPAVVVR